MDPLARWRVTGLTDIHATPLLLATLVERFVEICVQSIGNPANPGLAFLALVARLFGGAEAERLEKRLP